VAESTQLDRYSLAGSIGAIELNQNGVCFAETSSFWTERNCICPQLW